MWLRSDIWAKIGSFIDLLFFTSLAPLDGGYPFRVSKDVCVCVCVFVYEREREIEEVYSTEVCSFVILL
jgi:hypothetical protein